MDAVEQALREELSEVAARGSTVYYSEIAPTLGLDMDSPANRGRLGELLDSVSRREYAAGRPLLSAVVVLRGEGKPGKGFFALARELGLHDGAGDDSSYWSRELARCHRHWRGDRRLLNIGPAWVWAAVVVVAAALITIALAV